jgi:hypothetical protein
MRTVTVNFTTNGIVLYTRLNPSPSQFILPKVGDYVQFKNLHGQGSVTYTQVTSVSHKQLC